MPPIDFTVIITAYFQLTSETQITSKTKDNRQTAYPQSTVVCTNINIIDSKSVQRLTETIHVGEIHDIYIAPKIRYPAL